MSPATQAAINRSLPHPQNSPAIRQWPRSWASPAPLSTSQQAASEPAASATAAPAPRLRRHRPPCWQHHRRVRWQRHSSRGRHSPPAAPPPRPDLPAAGLGEARRASRGPWRWRRTTLRRAAAPAAGPPGRARRWMRRPDRAAAARPTCGSTGSALATSGRSWQAVVCFGLGWVGGRRIPPGFGAGLAGN